MAAKMPSLAPPKQLGVGSAPHLSKMLEPDGFLQATTKRRCPSRAHTPGTAIEAVPPLHRRLPLAGARAG
jgi:hypothetical protein